MHFATMRRILKVNLEIAGNESSMRFATCGYWRTYRSREKKSDREKEGESERERLISMVLKIEGCVGCVDDRRFSKAGERGTANIKRRARGRLSSTCMTTYRPPLAIPISRMSTGGLDPLTYCYLWLTGFWHASGANVLI